MRKLASLGILALIFGILPSSVLADAADGLCDGLKAKGVTKGLYGLCVAFHSSGDDRGIILAKYNARKTPDDPPLPMDGECTCWSMDQMTAAMNAMFCVTNASGAWWDGIVFGNAEFLVGNLNNDGLDYCSYNNTKSADALSESVAAQCIEDVQTLSEVHLGGNCFPLY